ncbi:hypothetical protein MMC13_001232 [Lambiella insularis]|nr:hypothetical protein [Lambiella insularis]
MSDTSLPRTPTPAYKCVETMEDQALNAPYQSPPPNLSADMTPPPSTQIPKASFKDPSRFPDRLNEAVLVSPPATLRIGANATYDMRTGILPSLEQALELPEVQLRGLVAELLPAVGEARMTAAHAKLQHSLLSIEIVEVAERAAVEHEMMRRELEVLQTSSPLLRSRAPPSASTPAQHQMQTAFEAAIEHTRTLVADNSSVQRKLKQAKKLIRHLDGKRVRLEEANELLRQRIRQNREHVDAMRLSGTISLDNTSRLMYNVPGQRVKSANSNPATRARAQDPFHTLLFAGQVLSGETNSVPSTPTHSRPVKMHHSHTRGTHSLSSLPMTPVRSRPMTADDALSTPIKQIIPTSHISFSAPNTQFVSQGDEARRADRDSTISASDQEEAYTDDDVPASQASQAATSMLYKYSGPSPDELPKKPALEGSAYIQRKLAGRLVKPGHEILDSSKKRTLDFHDAASEQKSKKAKLVDSTEQMGLGIAVWPSPGS